MAYNPYSAINAIYNFKKDWDAADKSGDTAAKNKAAANAQVYYNQLRKNGNGAIADELSALDASGAKYILDQYSTKNSGVDNLAYSTTMQGAVDKNNKLAGYIDNDRNDVQNKYNDIYNYANSDITKTDEYKSTYDKMMKKYDLSALQGRDNAVASGGSSNGGNIDSYAAANAMRQQASLTAQGQQIAHQAGLDAYNARVSNVTNILNNLGIYNDSTYSAMNESVNNDRNIANDYFNNAETAKNNDVARKSEIASVTGYVPKEWTYDNNPYFTDGKLNEIYSSDEFDATGGFTTIINNAKEKLKTTTDADERARLQATINYATQAKAVKTYQNLNKYGTYANEIEGVLPQETEARRQFDTQNDTALKSLGIESDLTKYEIDSNAAMNKYKTDADKEIANAGYENTLDQINLTAEKEKEINELNAVNSSQSNLQSLYNVVGGINNPNATRFIEDIIVPILEKENPSEIDINNAICNSQNIKKYGYSLEDAKQILKFFGGDTDDLAKNFLTAKKQAELKPGNYATSGYNFDEIFAR